MNNLISFPHLGNYYHPISRLLSLITKDKVMPAPPITKKTLELGTKYAPDTVCIPFKYNLGNFIESLEQGANVLFTAGGGCRYRYYAEVTETILRDLGYNFKFYKLIKQDMINWKDAYDIFKEINPNLTIPYFIHSIIYTILYIFYMDEIDKIIRKNIGFEIEKNAHQTLQKEMFNDFNKTSSITKLTILYKKYKKRFTNLSYLLWQKPLLRRRLKKKAKKYCKYKLGADGLDNVYRSIYLGKKKYDGIIHIKPFGCTPEITAIPIIQKVCNDYEIPIIFFSYDSETGSEGINTRLEAFKDLITIRRNKIDKSLSRN